MNETNSGVKNDGERDRKARAGRNFRAHFTHFTLREKTGKLTAERNGKAHSDSALFSRFFCEIQVVPAKKRAPKKELPCFSRNGLSNRKVFLPSYHHRRSKVKKSAAALHFRFFTLFSPVPLLCFFCSVLCALFSCANLLFSAFSD